MNIKSEWMDLYRKLNFNKSSSNMIGKAISVSILNQVVSSATNFLLGWYLVRVLTIENYGLYGIGSAISLFFAGIGDSLFLGQMVVHMPDKAPNHRLSYAARIFLAVISFCLVTSLLVSLFFVFGTYFWAPISKYASFAYAVMAACIAFHLKDFFIRHCYNMRQEVHALEINIIVAFFMATLLAGTYTFHFSMTVVTALWVYATANAIGALFSFSRANLPLNEIQQDLLFADWKEAWNGGKWMSLSSIVYTLRSQAHVIVVGWTLGPTGVGIINAARLLVMPAGLLTPALSQVFSPRLNSLRSENPKKLIPMGLIYSTGLLSIALIYSVILLISYKFVVPVVLGKKFNHLFIITASWCLYTCFLSFKSGMEITSWATKQFVRLMASNAAGAVIALGGTFFMITMFGLPGTMFGVSMGDITMTFILWTGMKEWSKNLINLTNKKT